MLREDQQYHRDVHRAAAITCRDGGGSEMRREAKVPSHPHRVARRVEELPGKVTEERDELLSRCLALHFAKGFAPRQSRSVPEDCALALPECSEERRRRRQPALERLELRVTHELSEPDHGGDNAPHHVHADAARGTRRRARLLAAGGGGGGGGTAATPSSSPGRAAECLRHLVEALIVELLLERPQRCQGPRRQRGPASWLNFVHGRG